MYQSPNFVKVDLDIKDNFAAYTPCHWKQAYVNIDVCQGNSQYLVVDAINGIGFDATNCTNDVVA